MTTPRDIADARAARVARNGADETPSGDKPEVVISGRELDVVTDEIVGHLHAANDPPDLFVRGGKITAVRADETGAPIVEAIDGYQVRDRISRALIPVRVDKDGKRSRSAPPLDLAANVLAQKAWPFPALAGVTQLPTLRPDGTIHADAGYDPITRLIYVPNGLDVPPIPHEPDAGEVTEALETLRDDLLGDFPFEDDANRANAVAMLLSPFIRPAIRGQVPLALLDASTPGTGKGLLANVCAVLATGRPAAARPLSSNDEELRKALLSVLLSSPDVIVLDNVETTIASPTLASVLTTDEWVDRVLGRSQEVRVPNRATWLCTGNNVTVAGDIGRRCYRIRLETDRANPDERTDFKHPDLLAWAQDNRSRLVAAALTLARAWWAVGRPDADEPPTMGGFTPWARAVAGILHHAGMDGFLANLTEFRQTVDVGAQQWETFIITLHELTEGEPTTAGTIANRLRSAAQNAKDAIPGRLLDDLSSDSFARKLGEAFRQRTGRRHGLCEWVVVKDGKDRNKAVEWLFKAEHPERAESGES